MFQFQACFIDTSLCDLSSLLRGWLVKRLDPQGPLAAAALEVDPPVVIQSAAAVVPAVTGRLTVFCYQRQGLE